jgi:deferrochelatase/peroxidase EfeB
MKRRSVFAGAAVVAAGGLSACGVPAATERAAAVGDGGDAAHQPGIATPPPAFAMVTAVDVGVGDLPALGAVLRSLGDAIAGAAAVEATVAVGASLFDARFGLAGRRPRRLTTMPPFANDGLDSGQCHGDLLLQVCGADAAVVGGEARRLAALAGVTRWQVAGYRHGATVAANGRAVDRNLFGFREGVGNPDVTDSAEVDRVVWVRGGGDEPAWAAGGSYQVVRVIRFATALWDAEPLARQEAVFGRRKADGVPLGGRREDEVFDYTSDPDGRFVPLDAHIRRANPRTSASVDSRMLRRGYSFGRGVDAAGQRDEGLIFICFQQDLERSFATVQRRLAGEALSKYILPVGGGYFFALPGVSAAAGDYLGRTLVSI